MGFVRFTKKTSLSDKDKKELKGLLDKQKAALQKIMKEVDDSLNHLLGRPAKKKAKKSKKGKKGR